MRETIPRYEAYYKNDFNDTLSAMLKRDDDGDLVLYSDHAERIAKLEARNKVLEDALQIAAKECLNPEGTFGEAMKRAKLIEKWIDAALREDR